MKKIKVEEVDMISKLPDSILHHILSLLPFKQVVQTSILSKKWKELWHLYPDLEFDRSVFDGGLDEDNIATDYEEYIWRAKDFFSSLVRILRNRKGKGMTSINKFTLDMDFFNDYKLISLLDRCIRCAIGCNVKELRLIFDSTHKWYNVCGDVLSAKSIEVLELRWCKLAPRRSKVSLSSLRKLNLIRVVVEDKMMKKIIECCPLIETLGISSCLGLKSFEACGLRRLNEFKLARNPELERVAINEDSNNVHFLSIAGPYRPGDMDLGFCQNLTTLSLSDFSIMNNEWLNSIVRQNLTSLSLSDVPIEDYWLRTHVSKLQFLEYLRIENCRKVNRLEISSPSLKTLMVLGCLSVDDPMIDTPNLQIFEYQSVGTSYCFDVSDSSIVSLYFRCSGSNNLWYVTYVEFMKRYQDFSDTVNLGSEEGADVIVPTDLRPTLYSPLSSLNHLNLRLDILTACWTITKLVDGLLWLAPHTRNISMKFGRSSDLSSFKFSFSFKKEGEPASCCKYVPIKCWQHCIEDVKLEITDESYSGERITKRHVLKGADIMEQIDALCGDIAAKFAV